LGTLVTKTQYLQTAKDDAMKLAQVQGAQAQNPNPNQPPAPPTKISVDNGHYPLKGNKDAKVTIVEFADFRCPFCERFFTDTLPQIEKDYIATGKVKMAFRNYAFLGPASVIAGNAAECANEQNKFWEYHDYLYKNQPSESDTSMYNTDTLTTAAGTLGIDTAQFRQCLDGKKYYKNVTSDK
jgi:protein-disulfide isomerase